MKINLQYCSVEVLTGGGGLAGLNRRLREKAGWGRREGDPWGGELSFIDIARDPWVVRVFDRRAHAETWPLERRRPVRLATDEDENAGR